VNDLKTKRNWLAATFLTLLLASLAAPLAAQPASADEGENNDVKIVPEGETWFKLESNIVTVLFPREGTKPMFIWWYTNAPDQIYVVKFKGLIEWFAFAHAMLPPQPEYYNHLRDASQETWMGIADRMGMQEMLRSIMLQMLAQMEPEWHSPFLNFEAARWTLIKPANISTPEGKVIGVSFGFNLTEVPYQPRFEFAENNILIRVRFYNETVHETVQGTDFGYDVNEGEMKMDLVVNKWVWNIDALKELVQRLQKAYPDLDVQIPEGKSRLALWVNLASINITKLTSAEEEPEGIETHSTATHMEVEGTNENIQANETGETEKPIEIERPVIKVNFANETDTLGGFFRFVSSAKVTDYPNEGDMNMVPVKAAYISGGNHMRLFIGYPYFGNGTLEHDPSIGVEIPNVGESTPKYTVQTPSGMSATPVVLGKYVLPLYTTELMVALIAVVSATAIILYAAKWKRKTPVNMVGAGTTG